MARSHQEISADRQARLAKIEKEEESQEHAALEKVGKLRDRFSFSATALAIIAALMAVWVRAPTLEIELPLGEAKASLNVGYVLAFGIPVITIVYALAIGNLVALRRYQFEIRKSLNSRGKDLDSLTMLRLGAPQEETSYFLPIDWLSRGISTVVLGFVLFLVPLAACGWIACDYLTATELFPANPALYPPLKCEGKIAPIDCRHKITFGEHLFGLKQPQLTVKPNEPVEAIQFGVVNGDIERACKREWEEGQKPKPYDNPPPEARRSKCVFNEFPRFVIPLTAWSNIVFTLLTAVLGAFGLCTYWWLPKEAPSSEGQKN